MTALARPRFDSLSVPRDRAQGRVVLHDVPWQSYKTIREALRDHYVFLTYDRGVLEIVTLSSEHEAYKGLLGLIVFLLARFFKKSVRTFGSFTHQRDDIEKGLEPDDCFYLASLAKVKGKKIIDLMRDPPPDLALEIDITSSSLDRLAIYAALKVPEVWQFDGVHLRVLVYKGGAYEPSDESPSFPRVPIADLVRFVDVGIREDDTAMAESLEKWLARMFKRGRKK